MTNLIWHEFRNWSQKTANHRLYQLNLNISAIPFVLVQITTSRLLRHLKYGEKQPLTQKNNQGISA